MSESFKTVFKYMQEASSNTAHKRIYDAGILKNKEELSVVDALVMESKCIKTTESNILSGLTCQSKFTCNGMDRRGLKLDVTSVAKGTTRVGVQDLVHTSSKVITYDMDKSWYLKGRKSRVRYSERDSASMVEDSVLLGRVTAACSALGGPDTRGLNITHAMERITQKSDMKQMFIKMYLMLMDLNLAATSKSTERRVLKNFSRYLVPNVNDNLRLGAVMSHEVVIDADQLTDEEIELLCISAESYPAVKFCGDNVYNQIRVDADDLRILCQGVRPHMTELKWVPDSLYRNIISVACKLDSLSDWFEVVDMMRGRPHLMRHVVERTVERVVHMDICRSTSCNTAFGMGGSVLNVVRVYPGYLSTSVSLIADALLGESLHAGATCLVEKMGGYGKLICQGHPFTDAMYNAILREYGISTMSMHTNNLMMVWCEILECSKFRWSMPLGWKEYILGVTDEMRNGIDLDIPQVLFDSAFIMADDSAWGVTRGWTGVPDNQLAMNMDDRKSKDRVRKQTTAFLWQMGVRKNRPHVFSNTEKEGEDILNGQDYTFLRGAEGSYKMTWLRYTIGQDVGGRVDQTENEASTLVGTLYKGTKCSVIYGGASGWSVETFEDPELEGIQESLGITPKTYKAEEAETSEQDEDELITPVTYGGNRIKNDGMVFKKLSAIEINRHVVIKKVPQREVVEIKENTEHNYNQVRVKGDGMCGIHAIVENMRRQGAVSDIDVKMVETNLNLNTLDKTFHTIEDLASVAIEYGCRLRVFDKESGIFYDYGDRNSENLVIDIVRDGLHYDVMEWNDSGTRKAIVKGIHTGSVGEIAADKRDRLRVMTRTLRKGETKSYK